MRVRGVNSFAHEAHTTHTIHMGCDDTLFVMANTGAVNRQTNCMSWSIRWITRKLRWYYASLTSNVYSYRLWCSAAFCMSLASERIDVVIYEKGDRRAAYEYTVFTWMTGKMRYRSPNRIHGYTHAIGMRCRISNRYAIRANAILLLTIIVRQMHWHVVCDVRWLSCKHPFRSLNNVIIA